MTTTTWARPKHAHWKHVVQTGIAFGLGLAVCGVAMRATGLGSSPAFAWLYYLALPAACWVAARSLWADHMYTRFSRRALLLACTAAVTVAVYSVWAWVFAAWGREPLIGLVAATTTATDFARGLLLYPLFASAAAGALTAAVGRFMERSIERRHPIHWPQPGSA